MFDLSGCGNVSQHLSISTGYRKGKKAGNIAEIWFVPRFLIEKKLKTTTSHFQQIFDGWKEDTAPVGIFFTHASWEDLTAYFYLTTKNLDFISHNNLYQLRNDHIMTMELRGIHGMDNFARYAEVVLKKFTFML